MNDDKYYLDSIIIIREKPINDYNVITSVSSHNDDRRLVIYGNGKNYTIDESFWLSSIIYFGEVKDYISEDIPVLDSIPDKFPWLPVDSAYDDNEFEM